MATNWHLAKGFRFLGSRCGIRPDPDRLDLVLLVSDLPSAAAGVFTKNRVCAAPVQVSRTRVPANQVRGIIACSGNANACTGEQGLIDAKAMSAIAAEAVGCKPEQMLVCSTGVIGRLLPMNLIEPGIRSLAPEIRSDQTALELTAQAIRTTDTCIKVATRSVMIGGREIRFTGMAKGAAMIGPNMATMLSFVLTDAPVAPADLQKLLTEAVDRSFNCISVEGHMSTNDTVLLLANGAAGGPPLTGSDLSAFAGHLNDVCRDLAVAIINDAEGITHLITIDVGGTRTDAEARLVAKEVAESALIKTAIFGADPNWGRVVSAAGYAGVEFREQDLSMWLGDFKLYEDGMPKPFDPKAVSAHIKNTRDISIRLVFKLGSGKCRFWTCDLSYEYIRLNADYTT